MRMTCLPYRLRFPIENLSVPLNGDTYRDINFPTHRSDPAAKRVALRLGFTKNTPYA